MKKTAYYLETIGAAQEIEGGLILRARVAWSLFSDYGNTLIMVTSIYQLEMYPGLGLDVSDFSFDDLT